MDLRCSNKLHGIVDEEFVDVACRSSFCGAGRGVVVIHRFNLRTGELVNTTTFRKPQQEG